MNTRLLPPVLLMLLGFAIITFMIVVESEPGALPLLLILIGMCWTSITLYRSRSHTK